MIRRQTRLVKAPAAFVLVAAVLASCTSDVKECTTIGCYSTVTLKETAATIDRSAPERITVKACLDDRCWSASVSPDPAKVGALRCGAVAPPDVASLECSISAATFEATIMLYAGDTGVKDGNVVHISVDDASGRAYDTGARSVSYTVSQPNGPGCDPTCRSTTL